MPQPHPTCRSLRLTLLILLLLSPPGARPALPQAGGATGTTGTVTGTVLDADSGNPLPGVVVRIVGRGTGTTTDLEGRYRLERVPAGHQHVDFGLIGYESMESSVIVREGTATRVDVRLRASPIHLGEMLVQADRALSAASSRSVRDFDLQVRPRISAQEMLQVAPGLIIAQHAGGGKAEQLFLRNFDADHGTDVAVSVDGMPVNMVSHGHGQGYADLHFLIPETVERVDVSKGPYFARHGNLATAGAVEFQTRSHLDENLLRLETGSFGSLRYTAAYQLPIEDPGQTAYFAGEYYRSDGPVDEEQGLQRLSVFAKIHTHLSERSTLTLDMGGFSSAWDASGQIPRRAVADGRIGRWGSLDPLEGGSTGRQNLNLTFRSRGQNSSDFTAQAWVSRYEFDLFSNFTFFLDDPDLGDMIEQTDDRVLLGVDSRYTSFRSLGPFLAETTLGGGLRADNADVALWKSPDRDRLRPLVDAGVVERNLHLWGQGQILLSDRLRWVLGLRGDYFTFRVEDRLENTPAPLPHASGFAQDGILSPKTTVVFAATKDMDLFANLGAGFHSNDARSVVLGQRAADRRRALRARGLTSEQIEAELEALGIDPDRRATGAVPRAVGGELGARAHIGQRHNLGLALWWLDLDEEFVYVGDAGVIEASGRTRRLGLDFEARGQLRPWLWADADVILSDGWLRDEPSGADAIPLAPDLTVVGGLTARRGALEGSLRGRHVGDRPANETDTVTAEGHTVVDLSVAFRWRDCRFHAVLENVLDVEWNEAQFDTESRLREEAAPVSELHFTPGAPRSARVGLSYLF